MRNFKILVLVVMSLFLTNSCYDDEGVTSLESDSRVIEARGVTLKFGRYFGKCQGNSCVEIFMLQENILREDNTDHLPVNGEFYNGNFVDFKGSTTVKIDGVLSDFPKTLLNNKPMFNTIGQPNAGDWGGIYLEYQDVNTHKQYLIDLNRSNIPKELRIYVGLIDSTIDQIGEINNQN